ncbi:hypothetical protein ES332_A13G151800v1 [Gossypium tomentosum]|uniref:Uncharacterized protein n=1 Tax=Gossypium tomentosum TaxID=34277 RepID=A0A5D2MKT5_GOSTO|nr:hypothetical protein ES332_A13G151800v1 [Gossypium tomentosum]TYH91988.1 hypothetical protein ES332_A13G151800v1 [Gossypium tomentosum]TYH91989.1 hypothetical protein ES332_A13G151800v1 [Gossypium tomentosum]TYH91990.1 hypothetical protein ES332_A13G151800v1 [Gossypium tomentosum]TYH91991.1 hypothetical protein ES332_A13G151800v1 [Gossypium tomentosum]
MHSNLVSFFPTFLLQIYPIMVDKSLHSSWDFLYPIHWNIELLSFCRQDMCHFIFHPCSYLLNHR